MNLIGVSLVWAGYAALVWGLELVRGRCTPFRTILWPGPSSASGDLSVTCPPSTSSGSSTSSTSGGAPVNPAGSYIPPQQPTSANAATGPGSQGAGVGPVNNPNKYRLFPGQM